MKSQHNLINIANPKKSQTLLAQLLFEEPRNDISSTTTSDK